MATARFWRIFYELHGHVHSRFSQSHTRRDPFTLAYERELDHVIEQRTLELIEELRPGPFPLTAMLNRCTRTDGHVQGSADGEHV